MEVALRHHAFSYSEILKSVGKLPPTFVALSSTEKDGETPIAQRKETILNRAFYERSWQLLQKILIQYGVTQCNLMAFEYTYLHWYQQLEHVPMYVPIEDVLSPLYEVEPSIIFG